MGEPSARVAVRILRDQWERTLGIICTSQTWHSPVMWAHYGDKHKGVGLGFDVPAYLAQLMIYEPERLSGSIEPSLPRHGITVQKLRMMLETKFKDWAFAACSTGQEQRWPMITSRNTMRSLKGK